MNNGLLPVLAQREDMRIVEVEGQPVVTARDLAVALGYSHERSVRILFNRNRVSFREFDTQINYKGGINLTLPYDTGEVEIQTLGGPQMVRYFTKRGALKVIMKSNQPRAVAVQEALIDLYEQVERGQLVSVGYLQDTVRDLRAEISRLRDLLPETKNALNIQVLYVPSRCRPRSIDDKALAFLQELFKSRPHAKVVELDRQLRSEAAKHGWKVGSPDSVYRVMAVWRKAANGLAQ